MLTGRVEDIEGLRVLGLGVLSFLGGFRGFASLWFKEIQGLGSGALT